MNKFALQLYSVRDALSRENFASRMKELAEMGYEGVEPAGLYDLTASEMKAACDAAGLKIVSMHIPMTEMLEKPDFYAEYLTTVGCPQAVIPHIQKKCLPGGEDWPAFREQIAFLIEKFTPYGIALAYHNHDFEFDIMPDGRYALDFMYDTFPADKLKTQLDTAWVNVAGIDPAEFIKKYSGRCPTVHLKDFAGSKDGGCPYALIGVDGSAPTDSGSFEFRPCGYGVQDFPAIIDSALDAQAGWFIVEQDQPSMGKSSLECAQMSIQYLKGLGK